MRVQPYEPSARTGQVCSALLEVLPGTVLDAERRAVEPAEVPAAAWGSPPIVLRCGVSNPPPGEALVEVEGVAWLPTPGEGGSFLTTTDRVVNVEVAVPEAYDPPANAVVDLAAAIKATVPRRD